MSENVADLPLRFKTVSALRGCHFFVEDYQRGYKWTEREVKDLLEDIEEFGRKHPRSEMPKPSDRPEPFYCLQPVVVQARPDGCQYELIDGQQRITTVYLILACLQAEGLEAGGNFRIDYRTREGSAEFLRKIAGFGITAKSDWESFLKSGCPADRIDNIDNFHFFEAYRTIAGWFDAHRSERESFRRDLLERCQVIWYETRPGMKAKETFIRLNSGKIALTPAELIKALLLQQGGGPASDSPPSASLPPPPRREEIAQEWDEIEYALQGEAFWGFINHRTDAGAPPTRIEFIFDLISERKTGGDPMHAFRHYAARAAKPEFRAAAAWSEVRSRFQYLREWYEVPALYHLVGFVITRGLRGIAELLADAGSLSKPEFDKRIQSVIHKEISGCEPLAELQYGEHNEKIQNILLLFNLQTILASPSDTRFPFDRYKAKAKIPSLEHIHAQNAEDLTSREEFKRWHDYYLRQLAKIGVKEASELRQEVEAWHAGVPKGVKPLSDAEAQPLKAARKNLEPRLNQLLADRGNLQPLQADDLHGIGNLALLDRDLNAGLGNEYFPSKRERIIAFDRRGKFIPAATKNVFLKYYSREDSPQIDHWGPEDCDSYLDAIAEALKTYGVKKTAQI